MEEFEALLLQHRGAAELSDLCGRFTVTVNGKTFVHWYDCITDYIF